jgi:hypothetical protein
MLGVSITVIRLAHAASRILLEAGSPNVHAAGKLRPVEGLIEVKSARAAVSQPEVSGGDAVHLTGMGNAWGMRGPEGLRAAWQGLRADMADPKR